MSLPQTLNSALVAQKHQYTNIYLHITCLLLIKAEIQRKNKIN